MTTGKRKSQRSARRRLCSSAIRMFRLMLAEGRSLIRRRNAIEDRAVELQGDRHDDQLLRTIPSIGPINTLTILAETGDLRRFHRYRQFLKFCGMDLATVQSGMFHGRSKISRYGNACLRRTLWLAGSSTVLKKANSASPRTALDLLARIHRHHARIASRKLEGITTPRPEQLEIFSTPNLPKPA